MNEVFCSVEVRMVRLEVHDGSRRRTVLVEVDPVRTGRDDTCEVQLPGDPTVSRLHAMRIADGLICAALVAAALVWWFR